MNEHAVSYHAPVLEGVRAARIKAVESYRSDLPVICHYAREGHADFCDVAASFLCVWAPTGAVHALCARHADAWLADPWDTDGVLHVPVLVPLKRVSA